MKTTTSIGIVGGNGALGSAIATGLLQSGFCAQEQLWISSRSGGMAGFEAWPDVNSTTDSQTLVDACPIVLLSVPPASVPALNLRAERCLLISVMAGISMDVLQARTGARRVVRAMSSPAARIGLAYSPWCANPAVTDEDRSLVRALFGACGLTDEVPDQDQIDCFTALTGPVPGFVAYYADCMVRYAVEKGIDPGVAERAMRQLFHASGVVLSTSTLTPAEHVREMVDYAGTTAAGLTTLERHGIAQSIGQGLDAARRKARSFS